MDQNLPAVGAPVEPTVRPAAPRVEACIAAVMDRHQGASTRADARYYEAVHQELAPLARELERLADSEGTRAVNYLRRARKAESERDAFKQSLYAELDTNLRLRELGGALADEPMTPFIERVIAERNTMREALRAMLDDDDHDAAKSTARAALDGLGA